MKIQYNKLIAVKIKQFSTQIHKNQDRISNIGSNLAWTKCFEIAQKGASLNSASYQEPALPRLLHGGSRTKSEAIAQDLEESCKDLWGGQSPKKAPPGF